MKGIRQPGMQPSLMRLLQARNLWSIKIFSRFYPCFFFIYILMYTGEARGIERIDLAGEVCGKF